MGFIQIGVRHMIIKKRILLIATFLIITAIAVVLCIGYFTEEKKNEYDGILAINSSMASREWEGEA